MSERGLPPGKARLPLVIVGDVRLYREGIARILSTVPEFDVVSTAASPTAALDTLSECRPEVLLIDMAMQGSLSLLRSLEGSGIAVVALALPEVERTFLTCVEAGMASYVPRDASVQDLIDSIEDAVRGEVKLHPRLAGSLVRRVTALSARIGGPAAEFDLTRREIQVAELVSEGKTNKRVAAELHISVATVKNHVHNILKKTGAARRSEIAARWSRHRSSEPSSLRARRNLSHLNPGQ